MAEKDPALLSALKQAKTKHMDFAFVAKSASEGGLIVNKTKVPPKQVNDTRTRLGGGQVLRGRCHEDGGTLVFEVPKEPPGTLAATLKKVIQAETGLLLKVEVRVVTGLEEEAEEAEEAEGVEGAEGAPTPETPVAGKADGDTFKAQLRALKPDFDKALAQARAAKAPVAEDLDGLFAQMVDEAKATKFGQALLTLANIRTMVKEVLHGSAPTTATTPPTPSPTDVQATFKARLQDLRPNFEQALKADPARAQQLHDLFAQMTNEAKAQKFPQALEVLEKLEALIKASQRSGQAAKEIQETAGFGNVVFVKTKLAWETARKKARAEVARLGDTILADPETQAQPDWADIKAAVDGLAALLEEFDERLGDTLDRALNATQPAVRQKEKQDAVTLIGAHLESLKDNPLLQEMDKNPFGSFRIYTTLEQTLTVLANQLSK